MYSGKMTYCPLKVTFLFEMVDKNCCMGGGAFAHLPRATSTPFTHKLSPHLSSSQYHNLHYTYLHIHTFIFINNNLFILSIQ